MKVCKTAMNNQKEWYIVQWFTGYTPQVGVFEAFDYCEIKERVGESIHPITVRGTRKDALDYMLNLIRELPVRIGHID